MLECVSEYIGLYNVRYHKKGTLIDCNVWRGMKQKKKREEKNCTKLLYGQSRPRIDIRQVVLKMGDGKSSVPFLYIYMHIISYYM